MSDNGEKENQEQPEELPEFKGEYFWAFAALMLYKLGGFEVIRLEHLEKFDFENDCPQVTWDARNRAFIMRNKEQIEKNQTISIPGNIRKKLLRNIIKKNFS
jgi:hypothetical protein